jgi:uncharacterized membrane protein YbhN (UPF0104 family)
VSVETFYYFSFVPIIIFLIRLPLSFDGFGIHEGGYVYFLSLVKVDPSIAFSVGAINHLMFIIVLLPGCIFYILNKKQVESISKE